MAWQGRTRRGERDLDWALGQLMTVRCILRTKPFRRSTLKRLHDAIWKAREVLGVDLSWMMSRYIVGILLDKDAVMDSVRHRLMDMLETDIWAEGPERW